MLSEKSGLLPHCAPALRKHIQDFHKYKCFSTVNIFGSAALAFPLYRSEIIVTILDIYKKQETQLRECRQRH